MIIVDSALAGRVAAGAPPIRIGMIGAGFMASGVVLEVNLAYPDSMRVTAIANRTPERAVRAYAEAGQEGAVLCDSAAALARAVEAGRPAVTEDPMLVATSPHVDVLLEVTGAVGEALPVVLAAIAHGKHVALMNAELDGTVGPLLKRKAEAAGVVYTNVDGDQPGVEMNLWRFVRGLGVTPVLCGNIGAAGPLPHPDHPGRLRRALGAEPGDGDELRRRHQDLLRAGDRGQRHRHDRREARHARLHGGGRHADRRGGEALGPGAAARRPRHRRLPRRRRPRPRRLRARHRHPRQRHYFELYKLGEGPLYCFYTPYHLCHFEVPATLARAVLFGDATIAPAGRPRVEVVALAKRDLREGEDRRARRYTVYGEAETAEATGAREPAAGWHRGRRPAAPRGAEGPGADLRRRGAAPGPAGRPAAPRAGRRLRPSPPPVTALGAGVLGGASLARPCPGFSYGLATWRADIRPRAGRSGG
jgi:hypothetical protein